MLLLYFCSSISSLALRSVFGLQSYRSSSSNIFRSLLPSSFVCGVNSPTPVFPLTYTCIPHISRTACTEPQCLYSGALYLYLYLYSPYKPYGLYRASVPVQRCTLPLPIPLLPLLAVRPVQSLSACTKVHFNFTYTSTPPISRTACTEPQCLYKGAL